MQPGKRAAQGGRLLGADEARELGGRGEHLLHLFRAGELLRDGGALDGVRALEQRATLPLSLPGVVRRRVAAREIGGGD